ncbi:hypothetical protein CRUP_008097, partial [Coryphaenoides rupestris]
MPRRKPGLSPLSPPAVTWCVMSDAEEHKCQDLAGNATLHNVRGTLLCVRGLHSRDCMEKIKSGMADAASMFVDDIYAAGLCYGLELAAGESRNGVGDCVPGVQDPQHDPRGTNPKNLCEACIGDDNDRHICANNPRERHFGEAGAL